MNIIGRLTSDTDFDLDASKVASVSYTVQSEVDDLQHLKGMLGTQGTLRPIFECQLRQKRSIREQAMALRKLVAESGLDYTKLQQIFRDNEEKEEEEREPAVKEEEEAESKKESTDEKKKNEDGEDGESSEDKKEKEEEKEGKTTHVAPVKKEHKKCKEVLLKKVEGSTESDIDDLVRLLELHFNAKPVEVLAKPKQNKHRDEKFADANQKTTAAGSHHGARNNMSNSNENNRPPRKNFRNDGFRGRGRGRGGARYNGGGYRRGGYQQHGDRRPPPRKEGGQQQQQHHQQQGNGGDAAPANSAPKEEKVSVEAAGTSEA